MNRYTPTDGFAVTDAAVAEPAEAVENTVAAEPAADTVAETPADDATSANAAQAETEPAESAEESTDTQPAEAETPAAQPAKGGPNEEFAAQRRLVEQAEAAARQKLFNEMTAGMTNPATGQPFAGMEEWNNWREDTRLKQLARQTGQTVEALRQQEADAAARAKAQWEASDEYKQAKAAEQLMQQQLMQMQFDRDLAEIKALNPAEQATTVQELGGEYMRLRAAGVDNATAYKVLQVQAAQNVAATPPSTGDVKHAADTRKNDFYSREELDAMSSSEMNKNWDKVMKSVRALK